MTRRKHIPNLSIGRPHPTTTVDSLDNARECATQLGGEALPGEWANPFFKVCNIADSEGNHIQLREFLQEAG